MHKYKHKYNRKRTRSSKELHRISVDAVFNVGADITSHIVYECLGCLSVRELVSARPWEYCEGGTPQ